MQWFRLKKEEVCFRNVLHCFEYFLQQWAKLLSMLPVTGSLYLYLQALMCKFGTYPKQQPGTSTLSFQCGLGLQYETLFSRSADLGAPYLSTCISDYCKFNKSSYLSVTGI